MQETWVQLLDGEDPGEKERPTHSRVLARRIPWTEEPGGLQSMGSHRSDTTERLNNICVLTSPPDGYDAPSSLRTDLLL